MTASSAKTAAVSTMNSKTDIIRFLRSIALHPWCTREMFEDR
ncbi:hypothetical protein [Rhodococcus sp. ABRD24]|nr:hypothetical protein [Rhodococcus sp. ABRD24]